MPIQTRCPSCAAAVPNNAAWCSLCHADLRPRSVATKAATIVPGRPSTAAATSARTEPPVVSVASPDSDDAPDPEPSTGRHSRSTAPETSPARAPRALPARGRHATGGSQGARRSSAPTMTWDDEPLAIDPDATPDEVDEIADRFLTRLALSEPRARMLDPQELPGGKWGFAAAATGGVVALLLALYTILGLLFGG